MQLFAASVEIRAAGRWLEARGWAPASAGNYSVRLDESRIAITVSGSPKGRLTAADVTVVDYEGRPLAAERPSAETALHAVVYRLDGAAGAVVHTHSVFGTILGMDDERMTALDLRGYELLKVLPGITTHDTIVSLPVFDNTQDMPALAGRVADRWRHGHFIGYLIRGHGLYTWASTMDLALRSVEALEFLFSCEAERRRLRP
ncbi:MAG: methylthioribulose 1-phosphate dehydratase [Polyangiaceae bacterium]